MTSLAASPLHTRPDDSFESIYRRHVRDVYGFSLSMLGNAEDAEDVAQTTFLNAYRALERGEQVEHLRAWLLAIAHNLCRQRFRTASRRPQTVELDPEAAEAFYDEDAPTAQEIRHAMDQLSFNQRTVLVLREIEGLSYEEIAEAMETSLSAVETLLFRARQALREQLEAAESDLGCDAVQRLISLQLDGKLSRQDKGLLRAHLRTCGECARFARSQRARKRIMPSLIAVPLPVGLTGGFHSIGAGVLTSKVAALAVSAALVGTGVLVETGAVPKPGRSPEAKTPAPALIHAASADVAASAPAVLVGLEFKATSRLAKDKRLNAQAKAKAHGKAAQAKKKANAKKGGSADATHGSGGSGGSGSGGSGSGGSGGSSSGGAPAGGGGSSAQPGGGTVGGVVSGAPGTVDSVVDEVQGKLPPLPTSPPVQLPSLPPVTLPPVTLPPVTLPPVPVPGTGGLLP